MRKPKKFLTADEILRIRRLWTLDREEITIADIARRFNVSTATIHKFCAQIKRGGDLTAPLATRVHPPRHTAAQA